MHAPHFGFGKTPKSWAQPHPGPVRQNIYTNRGVPFFGFTLPIPAPLPPPLTAAPAGPAKLPLVPKPSVFPPLTPCSPQATRRRLCFHSTAHQETPRSGPLIPTNPRAVPREHNGSGTYAYQRSSSLEPGEIDPEQSDHSMSSYRPSYNGSGRGRSPSETPQRPRVSKRTRSPSSSRSRGPRHRSKRPSDYRRSRSRSLHDRRDRSPDYRRGQRGRSRSWDRKKTGGRWDRSRSVESRRERDDRSRRDQRERDRSYGRDRERIRKRGHSRDADLGGYDQYRPGSPQQKRASSRRRSLSRRRERSRSRNREKSRSRSRVRSRSRRRSPSPRRFSHTTRRRSRTPRKRIPRSRTPPPARHRSRTPDRRRSRTPVKHRSRSPVRRRSRTPPRDHSESPARRQPRFSPRHRSKSPLRVSSRSPRRDTRHRSQTRSRSRSRPRHRISPSPSRSRRRSSLPRRNSPPQRHRSPPQRHSPSRRKATPVGSPLVPPPLPSFSIPVGPAKAQSPTEVREGEPENEANTEEGKESGRRPKNEITRRIDGLEKDAKESKEVQEGKTSREPTPVQSSIPRPTEEHDQSPPDTAEPVQSPEPPSPKPRARSPRPRSPRAPSPISSRPRSLKPRSCSRARPPKPRSPRARSPRPRSPKPRSPPPPSRKGRDPSPTAATDAASIAAHNREATQTTQNLITTYKRRGHFDTIKKDLFANFLDSSTKSDFSELLERAVNAELNRDPSLMARDRTKAAAMIERSADANGVYDKVEEFVDKLVKAREAEIERMVKALNVAQSIAPSVAAATVKKETGGKEAEEGVSSEDAKAERQGVEATNGEVDEEGDAVMTNGS